MATSSYLEGAADAMIAAARGGRAVLPILKKRCPHLYTQIRKDGTNRGLLSLWGRSCNVDENAGKTIVAPEILTAIGDLAGMPMRGRFVHAGLEHTYGYLFSVIETPYGFKRNRWVTTDLENGFGLDSTLLGDQPSAGTLLGNLTWFLAKIVFRENPSTLVNHARATVAPEILDYDFRRLSIERMVERATWDTRRIAIFTDIVPFPYASTQPGKVSSLLIYSVKRSIDAVPKLITAFPVKKDMVAELKASANSPGKVPIRLRYNAYVRGLYGKTIRGTRLFAGTTTRTEWQ